MVRSSDDAALSINHPFVDCGDCTDSRQEVWFHSETATDPSTPPPIHSLSPSSPTTANQTPTLHPQAINTLCRQRCPGWGAREARQPKVCLPSIDANIPMQHQQAKEMTEEFQGCRRWSNTRYKMRGNYRTTETKLPRVDFQGCGKPLNNKTTRQLIDYND